MVKVRTIAKFRRAIDSARLSAFFRPDGLDECLRCWVAWMHTPESAKLLDMKTQNGLVGESDGYGDEQDVHDHQRRREYEIAMATDAMIDSLTAFHRWAIYRSYNLGNGWQQWKFKGDLGDAYAEARITLAGKLKKNVCTANLF